MEYGGEELQGLWTVATHPRSKRNPKGYLSIDIPIAETSQLRQPVNFSEWPVLAAEGMNEAGFYISAQTFRGTQYQKCGKGQHAVQAQLFVAWALGNVESVSDLALQLAKICVVGGAGSLGLHWFVTDANRNRAVLE